jgi:hypothetical protein
MHDGLVAFSEPSIPGETAAVEPVRQPDAGPETLTRNNETWYTQSA